MAMATSSATNCEVCEDETVLAVAICHPCREFYCLSCVQKHQRFRATKDHRHVFFLNESKTELTENWTCEICETPNAVNICEICKQLYCNQCSKMHQKIVATKSHKLIQIECLEASSTVDSDAELASDFEGILRTEETSSDVRGAQTEVFKENQEGESHKVPQNGPKPSNVPYQKLILQEAKTFPINLDTDKKKIYVSGIASLPDGKIVVIDHSNDCLKIFHSDFRFLFKVNGVGNSFGIVAIEGNEIAVISSKKVNFYDLSRTGDKKLSKTFNVKGFSKAICIHQKEIGVVYLSESQGVQLFDKCGNTISDNVITDIGKESVAVSSSLAFDKIGNYFLKLIGQDGGNLIASYTLQGNYRWHVSVNGGIMSIAYIDDNLLVFCGHRYIVRVGHDGNSVTKIAETQKFASRVHYDERLRQLFYCNSADYHNIRIINYPKGGL